MQTHLKKRIDIVVEAPLLQRVTNQLDRENVSGYSVMPIIAGRGHEGPWTSEGQLGNASQMVAIVCVVDPARVDDLLAATFDLISRQIGHVTVTDVHVVRPQRF